MDGFVVEFLLILACAGSEIPVICIGTKISQVAFVPFHAVAVTVAVPPFCPAVTITFSAESDVAGLTETIASSELAQESLLLVYVTALFSVVSSGSYTTLSFVVCPFLIVLTVP